MPKRKTPIAHGVQTQTLYIRHIPIHLSDKIRVEAARRNCTMEWVAIIALGRGLPSLTEEKLKMRVG